MPQINPERIPKTHYDLTLRWWPKLVHAAEEHAARVPTPRWGMSIDEVIQRPQHRMMLNLMIEHAREVLEGRGHDTYGMTEGQLLGAIPENVRERIWTTFQQDYVFIFNFTLFGKRTFFFRNNLVRRLADTELNVDVAAVALPFNCCMFVYDDQLSRDALHAITGTSAPRDGVVTAYVTLLPTRDCDTSLVIFAVHSTGDESHVAVRRQLRLARGTRVEDALRTEWPVDVDDRKDELAAWGTVNNDAVFFGPGLRFVRIVINSALYLSSADPDVSDILHPQNPVLHPNFRSLPDKQRRNLTKQAATRTCLDYIDVGGSIPPYEVNPTTQGGGRQLDHRVRVRGHWKMQAHGPGAKERKVIFVEPYWKGPDAAEVINRPYIVR